MSNETIFTEFNSNKATLIRIDEALKMARRCSYEDNYEGWFKSLSFLRREAIVKMSDEQKVEATKLWLKLEKDMTIVLRNKRTSSFTTKIDNKLDEFEIFLREIMNAKGMLLKDGDRESGL